MHPDRLSQGVTWATKVLFSSKSQPRLPSRFDLQHRCPLLFLDPATLFIYPLRTLAGFRHRCSVSGGRVYPAAGAGSLERKGEKTFQLLCASRTDRASNSHAVGSTRLCTFSARVQARKSWTMSFCHRLFELLSHQEAGAAGDELCVRWAEDGESFFVTDPARFAQEIAPRWFAHQNYRSFVRQLNVYGFERIHARARSTANATRGNHPTTTERDQELAEVATISDRRRRLSAEELDWPSSQAENFRHPSFRRGHPELLGALYRRGPAWHRKNQDDERADLHPRDTAPAFPETMAFLDQSLAATTNGRRRSSTSSTSGGSSTSTNEDLSTPRDPLASFCPSTTPVAPIQHLSETWESAGDASFPSELRVRNRSPSSRFTQPTAASMTTVPLIAQLPLVSERDMAADPLFSPSFISPVGLQTPLPDLNVTHSNRFSFETRTTGSDPLPSSSTHATPHQRTQVSTVDRRGLGRRRRAEHRRERSLATLFSAIPEEEDEVEGDVEAEYHHPSAGETEITDDPRARLEHPSEEEELVAVKGDLDRSEHYERQVMLSLARCDADIRRLARSQMHTAHQLATQHALLEAAVDFVKSLSSLGANFLEILVFLWALAQFATVLNEKVEE
eukprot:m.720284 g.720284  ORF g.720284 m.720284 type:complete len:621 (+) comp58818_c0_seq10:193-2055(+)